jgi:hypothetical protein
MNEHILKGNEALERRDLQTARAEFSLALSAPDATAQRIAKNRLRELGDEPAPLRIAGWEELIIPVTKSRCCGARAVFVRSRDGGFVAKNCTRCKKSGYARDLDFPLLDHCGKQWPVVVIDKNYHYRCDLCGTTWLVADNVPIWSDLFQYDPLPAPGDPGWDGV